MSELFRIYSAWIGAVMRATNGPSDGGRSDSLDGTPKVRYPDRRGTSQLAVHAVLEGEHHTPKERRPGGAVHAAGQPGRRCSSAASSVSVGSQGMSGTTPVRSQLAPVTVSRTRASGSSARTWPLTRTGVTWSAAPGVACPTTRPLPRLWMWYARPSPEENVPSPTSTATGTSSGSARSASRPVVHQLAGAVAVDHVRDVHGGAQQPVQHEHHRARISAAVASQVEDDAARSAQQRERRFDVGAGQAHVVEAVEREGAHAAGSAPHLADRGPARPDVALALRRPARRIHVRNEPSRVVVFEREVPREVMRDRLHLA